MADQQDTAARIASFCAENPDIERIELLFPDMNGVFRGKWLPMESADKLASGGVRLPISTYALDIWGHDVDATELALSNGDPDGIAVPVVETLKRLPWSKASAAQMMMSLENTDGTPCLYDPRNILAATLERFKKLDLTPVIAPELEFYLFRRQDGEGTAPTPTYGEQPGSQLYDLREMANLEPVLDDIRHACSKLDIPADTITAESGPGQFEINFRHQADALTAADHASLFKRLVWHCARNHGLEATFMAKPYGNEAGSGMHVHTSILDKDGNNIFGPGDDANERLRHAIGGLMVTMNELQAIFAPNMNSYRRFQPKSHVPMSVSWGFDNRAVTIRVPQISGPAARLEHRLCGADVNPHLAIAAMLGGILIGLDQKIDPGAPMLADEGTSERLHSNWSTAVDAFANSKAAAEIFGEEYRRVYAACRYAEIAELSRRVTDVEYRTYLPHI